ncbi:MAG TPA: ATP-binding protein [Bacteroidales bacterium]|nr:ATP-binding protein [Bacteroidales bacterium]
METPFIFGKIAQGENFTDRESETEHLVTNFNSLINTIIISPRRWGKSSLVDKAASLALKKNKKLRICRIDLFNTRSEEQFYENLIMAVLKETTSKWEEAVESARKLLKTFVPKIILNPDPVNEFSISLDWNEVKKKPDEILDLAENLASSKGKKLIICIDEFQNMSEFEDPLSFQKKLRSHWQRHTNVAYCLYGSKRHMMLDVFTDPSMPFYKFGDLMFLGKIDTRSWLKFIDKRFSATGKKISMKQIEELVSLTDNHPYYVQQLAQQVWLRTDVTCNDDTVHQSFESIVAQLGLLFISLTETLTTNQLNLLKALLAHETALSSAEVLSRYGLVSSANVNRSRKSLITRDILDDSGGKLTFQDPLFRYWLEKNYFGA